MIKRIDSELHSKLAQEGQERKKLGSSKPNSEKYLRKKRAKSEFPIEDKQHQRTSTLEFSHYEKDTNNLIPGVSKTRSIETTMERKTSKANSSPKDKNKDEPCMNELNLLPSNNTITAESHYTNELNDWKANQDCSDTNYSIHTNPTNGKIWRNGKNGKTKWNKGKHKHKYVHGHGHGHGHGNGYWQTQGNCEEKQSLEPMDAEKKEQIIQNRNLLLNKRYLERLLLHKLEIKDQYSHSRILQELHQFKNNKTISIYSSKPSRQHYPF